MDASLAVSAAAPTPVAGLVLISPFWKYGGAALAFLPMLRAELDQPEQVQTIQEFLPELDLTDPAVRSAMQEFMVPLRMIDELRRAGAASYPAAR
jgi:pimeloyl-ACP methyl ester carboxylesterase